jgi:hypothetical protein
MRQNDPTTIASYKIAASKSRKEYIANNPIFKQQLENNLKSRVKIKNQELNLTFEMLQNVVSKVKSGVTNKKDVILLCDNDTALLDMLVAKNSKTLDYKGRVFLLNLI